MKVTSGSFDSVQIIPQDSNLKFDKNSGVQKNTSPVAVSVATSSLKPSNLNEVTKPIKDVVENAAQELQKFVESSGRTLSFSVDQNSGYQIVRVVDESTGELIRQLPSEELIRLAQNMKELNNMLVDQKA
jgi:flagellar protein FlaG